jgi:hypothetical protein
VSVLDDAREEERKRHQEQAAPQASQNGEAKPKPAPEPVLQRLSGVRSEPVSWLWRGWLPAGTLSMLDGDPGLGKSTLTLDLAARVSRGWRMPPEGGRDPGLDPAHVLLLGAEDSLKHTVRPRLDAAGADPDLVTSLDGFRVNEKEVRDPVLPWDLRLLAGWIREHHVALVIVDPLMAFLGGEYDAHKDQDIRRCMRPLRDLAEELGISILLLRHLNKLSGGPALYRGGGSIGMIGAARASLVVGRDPQEPKRHVLAMNKINLGPMPTSLSYFIEPEGDVARIVWEGPTALTKDDILWHATVAAQKQGVSKQDDAECFLTLQLANGPVAVKVLQDTTKAAGFSWRTVQNARAKLSIRAYKDGASWFWEMHDD